MVGQVHTQPLRFRKTAMMTGVLFILSLFSPLMQAFAFESNFYDGPGGYAVRSQVQRGVDNQMQFHRFLENETNYKTTKIVGMGLGAAVGGGLVAALGLASSPILAAAAIVASVVGGGMISTMLGNPQEGFKADPNLSFLSWAGGIAGGLLGFMIPGGSLIGASLGSAAGGMLGNALADSNREDSAKRAMGLSPSGLMDGAMQRLSGGFMGPMGLMAEGPMTRSRLLGSMGPEWAGAPGWFNNNGGFNPGLNPGMMPLDPRLQNVPAGGIMPMDFRNQYVWHDNNGELAYPGWEQDLYQVDGSASLNRRMPEWTTGVETSYAGARQGFGQAYVRSGIGSSLGSYSRAEVSSGGSSIENPDWSGETSFDRSNFTYPTGDVYSSHTTSDGETFDPSFEIGSNESLVSLTARYRDAVEELRRLTTQNAPALQRKGAHQEVQRLERMLHQALK